MLDFRIQTFLTVCRLNSYTRAAEELHITQPAVSQHIRYLEEYYGVRLFCYRGKKLLLTEEGRMLLSAAATMANDVTFLREHMRAERRKKLVFGATRTIGDFVLPVKLSSYILSHPDTDIRMLVDNTENLLKKIDDGELEFAVIEGYFPKAEYEHKPYSSERFLGVCAASYPFSREPQTLGDLFGERILLREPGSGTREIFERSLKQKNHTLGDFKQIIEIGSIHAIKSLVAASCGVTFLYETAVKAELRSGLFREISLADFNTTFDFTVLWCKNSIYGGRYNEILSELLT